MWNEEAVQELTTGIEDKRRNKRHVRPQLEIVSVEFVRTLGAENRLARVYDLLLSPRRETENKDNEG